MDDSNNWFDINSHESGSAAFIILDGESSFSQGQAARGSNFTWIFLLLVWTRRYYLNCKVMNFKYKVIKIYWSSKKYFLISFSIVILFALVPLIASGCFCFKCLKTNLTRSPHNLHLAFPNILTNFSDFVIVKRYSLNQDSHPFIGCVRNSNYFCDS